MKNFIPIICLLLIFQIGYTQNPVWSEQKVKNYLPHMTTIDVQELLKKTDMVIIPIGALEQHGNHLPIGTDIIAGIERCKLIAQERDILVAPILLAGQSPYHMGFAGTITLSSETIIKVHLEAVNSLLNHGFKRFILMNAHGGNRAITSLCVDQINQTTAGIAVSLEDAIRPFLTRESEEQNYVFDRHGGVSETSGALYLLPTLVQMDKAVTAKLTLPSHMQNMLPEVVAGNPTANLVFLAEGLKAEETGKRTSSKEMSTTGVWGVRNLNEASAEIGKASVDNTVQAAVKFIDKWNQLRPSHTK
ncbi:MAG: creatininase family protein [Flammeovirgaceae bacterium]|nr:creatininase family protein [Flammeovirgaceae bacterium]